jgi:hypothetical protein
VVPAADEFVAVTARIARSAEAGPQAARSDAIAGEGWDQQVGRIAHAIESVAVTGRTTAKETPTWTPIAAR